MRGADTEVWAVRCEARKARAQAYPAWPVRIIVGFPAGRGIDVAARSVGPACREWLRRVDAAADAPPAFCPNAGLVVTLRGW